MSVTSSFEISADQVNVNVEEGTVIVTGVDLSELVGEIGTEEILQSIDYSDIMEYVTQVEKDKADDEFDRRSDR